MRYSAGSKVGEVKLGSGFSVVVVVMEEGEGMGRVRIGGVDARDEDIVWIGSCVCADSQMGIYGLRSRSVVV